MATLRITRRLLSAYTDKESWKNDHKNDHIEAQSCLDVEEVLAWGVTLYRGLNDMEARAQTRASGRAGTEEALMLEVMPLLYKLWLDASEFFLDRARGFVRAGYSVAGLEAFEATVEEARCLSENLGLEDEIRPIEELMARVRPENPRPGRYGD